MTQPQAEFLDLYRAGLKTTADLMKASLQNAERLQNQQLVAIRSALDQQARSISDLSQARSIDELLSLQTRMAGQQFERAVGFWSELYQSQVQQAQNWWSEVNSTAQGVASNAAAALRQASPKPEQNQQQHQQQHQQHRKSA